MEKGYTSPISTFVLLMLFVAIAIGYMFVGGFEISKPNYSDQSNTVAVPVEEVIDSGDKSLQLKTIKFKECSSTMALNFLLDRSGSMQGNKIAELKKGMLGFVNKLSDNSVIGVQDFSSPEHRSGILVKVLVPTSYYKDIKDNLSSLVNSLEADGQTNMKSALEFSRDRIKEGKARFPNHKFAFLFLSDGQPVPSSTQTPSDELINELKSLDIRIFTIAYGSSSEGVLPLMKKIATSEQDAYYIPNEAQIEQILNEIAIKICE